MHCVDTSPKLAYRRGKNWNISKGGVTPHTPRNISAKNVWFRYGRIRQWKILALSVMHERAPVDVARYVQTGWSEHFHVFFSPQNFGCEMFEGGRCKAIVFYSSRSPPPTNSIAAVGFRFWVSSKTLQRPGAGVRRSHALFVFWTIYPIDISRIKSGIRRTPPTSFGSPKKVWERCIFHVIRRNISQKFHVLPPQKMFQL